MKSKVFLIGVAGLTLVLAVFVHGGVYTVKGVSGGQCYLINRFTGKTWFVTPDQTTMIPDQSTRFERLLAAARPTPMAHDAPPAADGGFATGLYKRKVRAAFIAGYTVDEIAAAKPHWSRDAVQHEYDAWRAFQPAPVAGFVNATYRSAIRATFDAGATVDDVAALRTNWSRESIQSEYDAWKAGEPAPGFRDQKYRDGVRRGFDAGFSVDDIVDARPRWSKDAVQAEYDAWRTGDPVPPGGR